MDDVSRGLLILGFSFVWLCFQILCYALVPFYVLDLIRFCERTNHGFLLGLINVFGAILLGILVLPLPFPLAAFIMLYLTNRFLVNHFSFTQEYRESFWCVFKKGFEEVVHHAPSSSSSNSSKSSSSSPSWFEQSAKESEEWGKKQLDTIGDIRAGRAENGTNGIWL